MSDLEYKKQIDFLLGDAKNAGDPDTIAFALLQIFKLSRERNKSRPPPTQEQIQWFVDMLKQQNSSVEEAATVIEEIYRRFGERPPSC